MGSDCTPGSQRGLRPRTAAARARAGAPGPSPAAAAFPTAHPPRGLCGAPAAAHPSLSSSWARPARRDRRKDCAFGLQQRGPAPVRRDRRWRLPLPSIVSPSQGLRGATAALHPSLSSSWARTARWDRRKTEPPDCRSAGPRRCAVPSMAAAAFLTVNPPQGLCGATAALHPWLASPWTRTARRDRRSACAWGCPGHWWQDDRLLLSRGLGPSRRLRHARPEGGSYLGAAPLRVWPDGPPSSPPSTWRWCCLRHAASKREPDRDGPPWEARAGVSPPSPGWRTTVWRTTPGAGGSVLFLARCAVMGMAFSGRPVAGPTRRRPLGHGVGA